MAYSPEELRKSGKLAGQEAAIEDLFDAASDLAPEARAAFLDANCSQPLIRAEVDRLLVHHDRQGPLDSRPLGSGFSSDARIPPSPPSLTEGAVVASRFRVIRLIGSGGMGEVYEAEDLQECGPVALKTIRGEIAANARLTARFRKELLLAQDVSHPNVCKVSDYWDLEQGTGRFVFFTMELLRGQTLAARIASGGPLKPKEALRILRQVAAGLDEVHRRGIVHRDLKPSNIFLVDEPDGSQRAVVMDFGLARTVRPGRFTETTTKSIMGTPMYMAPELFEGEAFTIAADIYSLGVTAFEIVTGANYPLVAPRSVISSLPSEWNELQQCFSRNPETRPRSAQALISLLEGRRRRWSRLAVAAAAIGAVTVAGAAGWNRITTLPAQARTTAQLTFDKGFTADPSSSADGKLLVYSSDRGSPAGDLNIWLQHVDTGEVRQLTNDPGDEKAPVISPDGKLIAYFSTRTNAVVLKPVDGGPERELAKSARNPQFSNDGTMLAYWTGQDGERTGGQIWIVSLASNTSRRIVADYVDARFPSWAPDGRALLFRGAPAGDPAAYSILEWWVYELASQKVHATGALGRLKSARLAPHDSTALWDGSQVLFAGRAGHSTNLWSLHLSSFLNRTWGDPAPFTNGAGLQDMPARLEDGRIAYASWRERIHIWKINCTSGELNELTSQDSMDTRVSASRDGNIIAFGRRLGEIRNVWVKDLRSGVETQLAGNEPAFPFISPGGKKVAFSIAASLRVIDLATGKASAACSDCGDLLGWTPDDAALVYLASPPGELQSVVRFDLASSQRRVLLTSSGLREASLSPDGGMITYAVRKNSTNSRIFVARRDKSGQYSEPFPITPDERFAQKPVWSDDARTVYYDSTLDGFECVWSQKVNASSGGPEGEPRAVKHFHRATFNLSHLTTTAQGFAQAKGSLFLSVDNAESNIWAVRP